MYVKVLRRSLLVDVAALAGLAAVVQPAHARSQGVTLRLLATTGNVPAWQAWKSNFERANPDITIALEHLNVAQYPQVLLTQLQSGNGPDLIYTQGGTGQIHSVLNLGESGRLVDLSKQPWVKRLPASARPLFTQGKNVFALPLAFVPTGILYNVDAFKQLNLKVPTTFAQLLNVCRTAKDKGKTAFTFSGSTTNSATLTQLIASSSVYGRTPKWNDARYANRTSFAGTAGWHSALRSVLDMKDAGCFAPDVAGLSMAAMFTQVGNGQALMAPLPSVAMGTVRGVVPNANLAVFPFPGRTVADTRAMIGYTDSLAVNAASSNKAAAIKFVNFIAREGQSRIYTNYAKSLSLHDANVGKLPAEVKTFGPFIKSKKWVLYPNSGWRNADVFSALAAATTGLITGQVSSIDAGLQGVDTAWAKSS